ncbi:MAG: hypothetical protein QOE93_2297 [Actinomycetota bacterium]|nr:hypothetical protein [Actinomycetota bacterium]
MTLSRRAWSFVAWMVAAVGLTTGCAGGPADAPRPAAAGGEQSPATAAPIADELRPIATEEVWRWPAPEPGSVGMPAADGAAVAATYGHLRLVLLDLDGDVRWEAERLGLRDVAPALTDDLVVAATETGVVAVDRRTGTVRWDRDVGERANSPVIAGGRAVVSTWEGSLTAFDLTDGRVAWRTALPGSAIGPAATDGATVVATWESELGDGAGAVAVDAADGRPRWTVAVAPGGVGGPAIVAVPAAATSVVVFVAGDIAAHGLDLDTGAERWRTPTQGRGSPEVPPLPIGGGEVLVPHRLAGMVLLDADSGEVQWGGSAGGVATRGGPVGNGPDGPFAFPTDDGRVVLVGPGWEPALLDWPGRVSGVALAPEGLVVAGTREARANHLIATRLR